MAPLGNVVAPRRLLDYQCLAVIVASGAAALPVLYLIAIG